MINSSCGIIRLKIIIHIIVMTVLNISVLFYTFMYLEMHSRICMYQEKLNNISEKKRKLLIFSLLKDLGLNSLL